MSISQQREINDLKQRVTDLEKKLAETAESLAYLHGKVLGGPEATLPTRKIASEVIVESVRKATRG